MFTVKTILILTIIVLIFFGIGKLISKSDVPLFKKIFKTKRNLFSTDIMVNNYWGNMISIFGAIIVAFMLYGPTNFIFYGIVAIAILAGYVMHISDAAGVSIDNAIDVFLNGNNKEVLRFMQSTMCFVIALLISGYIGTSFIGPKILVEKKKTQDVYEIIDDDDITSTKDKESKFYEDMQDLIINE